MSNGTTWRNASGRVFVFTRRSFLQMDTRNGAYSYHGGETVEGRGRADVSVTGFFLDDRQAGRDMVNEYGAPVYSAWPTIEGTCGGESVNIGMYATE